MKGYQQTSMNLMLDNTVSEEGDNSLKQREKNSVKTGKPIQQRHAPQQIGV